MNKEIRDAMRSADALMGDGTAHETTESAADRAEKLAAQMFGNDKAEDAAHDDGDGAERAERTEETGGDILAAQGSLPESDADAITRLAKLEPLEYDRMRKTEAKRMGCRASALDKAVRAARRARKTDYSDVLAAAPPPDSDLAGDAATRARRGAAAVASMRAGGLLSPADDDALNDASAAEYAGSYTPDAADMAAEYAERLLGTAGAADADGAAGGPGFTLEDAPPHPLEDLAERAATNPGEPFKPEVVAALAELKAEDAAGYENLRSKLKLLHVRVTALDKLVRIEGGETEADPTQTDRLIALADEAELFHAPDDTAYADVRVAEHRETWPVKSRGFRRWLLKKYFEATKGAPNGEAMQAALSVVEARAHYDGPERAVSVRIGGADGHIYIDLCDEAWRAIEVSAGGWRIVPEPPVRFRRKAGMLALPEPARGGSVSALQRFVNVKKEDEKNEGKEADFVLLVAWLLAALRDYGPYPVLIVTGEQGAAKSTLITLLRLLIDPNAAKLRALPREDRDLFISAVNAHLLAFDNVSGLPNWISDTLCRIATGGGFAVRALYTDDDEMLFDTMRPIALNGISDVVSRPDLADRGLFLTLEAIPETQRRPDKELMADFERERPAILGALLDAMAAGLKALPNTTLARAPRMADFALWATACEGALPWAPGTFLAAYGANRRGAVLETVEADAVGAAVLALMAGAVKWEGPAELLLGALREKAGEAIAKGRGWPASARALSNRLRRLATFLRALGINVAFKRDMKARTICVSCRTDRVGNFASFASSSSFANGSNGLGMTQKPAHDANGAGHDANHDANRPSDDDGAQLCVIGKPLKTNRNDDDDANDDEMRAKSALENARMRRGRI